MTLIELKLVGRQDFGGIYGLVVVVVVVVVGGGGGRREEGKG